MKHLLCISSVVLVAASLAGCTTPRPQTIYRAAGVAKWGSTCRQLVTPTTSLIQRYCGDAGQWARVVTWAATVGVTCRNNTKPAICMSAQQWVSYDKSVSKRRYFTPFNNPDFISPGVVNPSSADYIGLPASGQCCLP